MIDVKEGCRLTKDQYRELLDGLRKNLPGKASELQSYWSMGDLLHEIGQPRYGSSLFHKLASAVGVDAVTLYDSRRFRAIWPEEDAPGELEKKGVLWTQMRCILHSKLNEDERRELVKYVQKDKPTVKELKARVRAMTSTILGS